MAGAKQKARVRFALGELRRVLVHASVRGARTAARPVLERIARKFLDASSAAELAQVDAGAKPLWWSDALLAEAWERRDLGPVERPLAGKRK